MRCGVEIVPKNPCTVGALRSVEVRCNSRLESQTPLHRVHSKRISSASFPVQCFKCTVLHL